MKRTGSLLVIAGAFALIFHVSSQWIEPPVQAATQDPELNQIISSLRSIENRLSRIESASILRDSYEPSSARSSRMESDLSSVAGIGSDLARIGRTTRM